MSKNTWMYTLPRTIYMLYYWISGMNLMYVHDDSETLEDSFTILLTDGKHQIQRRVTVQIVPQNDEEPSVIRWDFQWSSCWSMMSPCLPESIWHINLNHVLVFFWRNNGLEVEPGQTRLISSATLFANDIDTPSTEVLYIFKSVPSEGLLQLKVGAIKYVTKRDILIIYIFWSQLYSLEKSPWETLKVMKCPLMKLTWILNISVFHLT